jgi:hypothetical protein
MDGLIRSQYRIPRDVDDWLKDRARDRVCSKNAELVSSLRKLRQIEMEAAKGKAPNA